MLAGSLKRLGLSNNTFSGVIPFELGQLQGTSVFLKDNRFQNTSTLEDARFSVFGLRYFYNS